MRRTVLAVIASLTPFAVSAAPQFDVADHLARDWFSHDMKLGCINTNADRIPCKATEDTFFHVYYSADRSKALAVVEYLPDATGNAVAAAAVTITESPVTGGWGLGAPIYDLNGQEPSGVRFAGQKVSFVLKTRRPNDGRCCPTGHKTFSLPVR